MDLETWMLDLKAGNREALSNIYEETKNIVYSIVYSILKTRESTEDVMQETYYKIAIKINKYKNKGTAKAWICKIARNLALDTYRKNIKIIPLLDGENNTVTDYEPNIEFDDTVEIAKKVLSETELTAVLLFTVGELSHKEISGIIKKPYATVRWNYYNSIEKIKKYIAENQIEI